MILIFILFDLSAQNTWSAAAAAFPIRTHVEAHVSLVAEVLVDLRVEVLCTYIFDFDFPHKTFKFWNWTISWFESEFGCKDTKFLGPCQVFIHSQLAYIQRLTCLFELGRAPNRKPCNFLPQTFQRLTINPSSPKQLAESAMRFLYIALRIMHIQTQFSRIETRL